MMDLQSPFDFICFQSPWRMLLAGPSMCGKSSFIYRLLTHADELIDNPPQYVLYHYGEYQPLYTKMATEMNHIKFFEGVPQDMESQIDSSRPGLIILDDLIKEVADTKWLTGLFTKGSHHKNISVLLVSQNLFEKGLRTPSLNCDYITLFKNPRDSSQVTHLAKQTHPKNVKFIQEAFADATAQPFSYLLLDLKIATPDFLRVRSNIFPGQANYVYVPKKQL